eukprot:2525254-Pyramimonas_sp.AAC.1
MPGVRPSSCGPVPCEGSGEQGSRLFRGGSASATAWHCRRAASDPPCLGAWKEPRPARGGSKRVVRASAAGQFHLLR